MKMIIDIPEDKYEWLKKNNPNADTNSIVGAIANGISISTEGELISREDLKKAIKSYADDQYAENEYLGEYAIMTIIDKAPTVDTDLSEYSEKLWKEAYERGKKEGYQQAILDRRTNF